MTGQDRLLAVTHAWTPLAVQQVRVSDADDPGGPDPYWMSEGDDPQFHIRPEVPVSAGWYRVTAPFAALDDVRLEPCLYVDYGAGISESTRIDLRFAYGAKVLDCVFQLRHEARMLRFDPLSGEGGFRLGEIVVRGISEREALWRMLRTLLAVTRDRQPIEAGLIAASVRHQCEHDGIEHTLEWMWARYIDDAGTQDALYRRWIANAESISPGVLSKSTVSPDDAPPMFSIVLVGGDLSTASDCVDAVCRQSFGSWELLVAETPSGQHSSLDSARDRRIRILSPGDDHGDWIRLAIASATARWVWIVPAGGRLHEHALAWYAEYSASAAQARMLYGDEDFVDMDGSRHRPWFKPCWNPELVLAQDHLAGVVAIDVALANGVLDAPLQPGAEIYDLALRCSERLGSHEILHVPHIVRHNPFRDEMGDDGLPSRAGAASVEAARHAVAAHLSRLGIDARTEATPHGTRVRYMPPADSPHVEILIPTRDRIDLLSRCIDSLLDKTSWRDFRVTVIDNGSVEPESIDYLSRLDGHDRVRVLPYDRPFNYSAINNFAARQSNADVLLLLNNDIEVVSSDWLNEMVSLAMRPQTGAVGAKLYYPEDTIQHAGVILGVKGVAAHPYVRESRDFHGQFNRALLMQNLSAVTAACLAVRRSVFEEVGGLDETIAVAFNDVDFCLRLLTRGYRNVWTPFAELYHHESASRGYEDDPVKQARFSSEVRTMRARWASLLDDDPAYSPNLALSTRPFDIDPQRRAPSPRDVNPVSLETAVAGNVAGNIARSNR